MPETILPDPGSGHQSHATAPRLRWAQCTHWKRTPELHALGRALLELRAGRGLSQEEFGFAVGLHRNYVGSLERGEINPSFRVLLKLATGLRPAVLGDHRRLRATESCPPARLPAHADPGQMTGRRTARHHVASSMRMEPAPAQRTGAGNGPSPRPRRLVR